MYNYNELNAVSLSPTKKDYYQIWNELIEVSSKLSSRWDPSATNESDPGIVLLKVLTAIADKLNYNIDANTLEAFMPSAAQESSMRKLCEMLGYEMRYYQSASTNVRITYNGTSFPTLNDSGYRAIYIDRFTNIQDAESTVNFITLEPIMLTSFVRSATVECLEGELVNVQTDAGNVISLTHLDDNLRFYLPERQIASNGIFISNVGKDAFWTQTDNLNTSLLGSTVYKFGYDSSRGLPYIQFPDDIGSLIGTGLTIQFVRTRGVSGNISSGFLKTMTEPLSWSVIKENSTQEVTGEDIVGNASDEVADDWSDLTQYSITNLSAAKNGKNTETIDEAYWNYQKQVGTFDTLVTCRDYMNKIYQMTKSYVDTNPLVSNIIVSDIRDDINRAYTLVSFSEQGLEMERLAKQDAAGDNRIEYFDLMLYPFQATLGQTQKDFEDSFKYTSEPISTITAGLDDNKTIAHRFRNPDALDISCIKVYFQISARLTTTSKISYLESLEVQQAAHQALYKEFNMRNLSFGDELPYDTILQVLTLADPRIKNVTLDDPKMTVVVCTVDGQEYPIITNELFETEADARKSLEFYKQLVLDNVLAGRVGLLNEQTTFKPSLQELPYPDSKSKVDTTASCLQANETLLPLVLSENAGAKKLSKTFSLADFIVDTSAKKKLNTFMTTRPGTFSCKLVLNTDKLDKDNDGEVIPVNYQDLYTAMSSLKIKLYSPGQTEAKYTLNFQPYKPDANYTVFSYLRSFLSWVEDGIEYVDDKDTKILEKTSFILHPSSESADLKLVDHDFMLCQVPFNLIPESPEDDVFDKITIQFIPVSAFIEEANIKDVLEQISLVIDFYEAFEACSPVGNYTATEIDTSSSKVVVYGSTAANYEIADYALTASGAGTISADLYWPGINPTYSTTKALTPAFVENKLLKTYTFNISNKECQLSQSWKLAFKVPGKETSTDAGTIGYLALTRNTADSTWMQISKEVTLTADIIEELFTWEDTGSGAYFLRSEWLSTPHRIEAASLPAINSALFVESGNVDNKYHAPGLRLILSTGQVLDIPMSELKFSFEESSTDNTLKIKSFGPFKDITFSLSVNTLAVELVASQGTETYHAALGWITTPGLLTPAWICTSTSDISGTQYSYGNAYLRGVFGKPDSNINIPNFKLSASGLQSAYVVNNTSTSAQLNLQTDSVNTVAYAPAITVPAQLDLTKALTNPDAETGVARPLDMAKLTEAIAGCTIFDEETNTLKPLSELPAFQPDELGESKLLELSAPTKITSDFRIQTEHISHDDPLVLAKNEVVQFRSPNFKTTATYPAYVNYYVHLSGDQSSKSRAAAYKKGNTAVPATMQSLVDFLEGGPAYMGQHDYNAYPLSSASASCTYAKSLQKTESAWNCKKSWEEKVNSMPEGILKSYTLPVVANADDAEKAQAQHDKLLKTYGALFVKDQIILSEATDEEGVKGTMSIAGSLSEYKLFEPISKYTIPSELKLWYVSITKDNFETWLRWLRGTAGSIVYREDIEDVPAGVEPSQLTKQHLINNLYKRAAANTKRNIGYLVDSTKFKYSELTGLGINTLETLYVPRLWRENTPSHTVDGVGIDASSSGIAANTEYQLKADEYILISYSTSEGRDDGATVVKNIVIPGNSIVKSNFDLVDSDEKAMESTFPKTSGYGPWVFPDKTVKAPDTIDGMFTLGATEQIEVREPIEVKLDEAVSNLYWEVKDPVIQGSVEKFPFDADGSYILQPGEYLFYTNEAKESFVYYGSGAEIKRGPKTPNIERPASISKMSMDEISSSGLVASMPWVPFNLSAKNAYIQVSEYQVINLVEKDSLLDVTWLPDETDTTLSNKFRRIQSADYTVQGNEGTLPSLAIDSHYWEARGKLELNMSPTNPQVLISHRSASGQEQARSFVNIYKTLITKTNANKTTEQVVQTYTALPSKAASKPTNPDSLDLGGAPDAYANGELPTTMLKAHRDGDGAPETTMLLYSSSPLVGADGDLRFVDSLECPIFKACTQAENTYSNDTPFAPVFTDGFTTLDLLGHLSAYTIIGESDESYDPASVTEEELKVLEHTRPALSLSTLIPDSQHFGILPILYMKPEANQDSEFFAAIRVTDAQGESQELSIFNYNSDPANIIYNAQPELPQDRYLWTWWSKETSGSTGSDSSNIPEVTPDKTITLAKTMKNIAFNNDWTNTEQYTEFTVDDNVKVEVKGGSNTGKWYSNKNNWRLYQSELATLTVSVPEDMLIASVKLNYETEQEGVLIADNVIIASGETVDINADSITFNIGSTNARARGQIHITSLEVAYWPEPNEEEIAVIEVTDTRTTGVTSTESTYPGQFELKPGLNLVVIRNSGILDLFVNKSRSASSRQDLLRIGELKILTWENMLNPQLAFESHNTSIVEQYDTRLKFKYKDNTQTKILTIQDHEALDYIRKHDRDHKFYYTYQPAQESGLDLNASDPTDTLALPKAWFDTQNLANKFVISTLDTEYLTEFVDVSKFSKQGALL